MANLGGFNANDVEPSTGFDPLPGGKYEVVIVDSDVKTTKAGTGTYLEFKCEVIAGEYRGRNLWGRITRENPNDKARQFGDAQLSALCRAVNVMAPNDSSEFHNLPFVASVKLKPRSDDPNQMVNEINAYEARGAATEAKPAATAGVAKAPWSR